MKYEETGIYNYCLNLGISIKNRAEATVIFYVPSNAVHLMPGNTILQRSFHKLISPSVGKGSIWHSTYQHTDYLPSHNSQVKIVLTVHDLNFLYDEQIPDFKKKKYLKNLQKRVDRAHALVCVSEYGKKDLVTFCDTGNKQVSVIHNGSTSLQPPVLKQTSYKPRRPFLFSIGSIRRKKNFHALLPLLKLNSYFDLVIAGKTEEKDYLDDLKNMARNEGVQDNLHLVGHVTEAEKSWYYHNCEAFLFPSIAEGFGLPPLEAMSAGKPVFLSNRTSLPEVGSTAAFYFKDFSRDHMHNSFKEGMSRFETNNMAEIVRKRAGQFSWESAASQYIKIYESLSI